MISYLFIFELNLYYDIRISTVNLVIDPFVFAVKNIKCEFAP